MGYFIGMPLTGVHLSYAYLSHGRVSPIGHLMGVSLIDVLLTGGHLISGYLMDTSLICVPLTGAAS
jgi:hypothetical protein